MSKKHFEAIAATIRVQYQSAMTDDARFGIECVASDLAETFANFNPNFDRQRFLIACGVREGQATDSAGRRVNY